LVLSTGAISRYLKPISSGNATPKEISDYTGLPSSAVSKYLNELVNNYEDSDKRKNP